MHMWAGRRARESAAAAAACLAFLVSNRGSSCGCLTVCVNACGYLRSLLAGSLPLSERARGHNAWGWPGGGRGGDVPLAHTWRRACLGICTCCLRASCSCAMKLPLHAHAACKPIACVRTAFTCPERAELPPMHPAYACCLWAQRTHIPAGPEQGQAGLNVKKVCVFVCVSTHKFPQACTSPDSSTRQRHKEHKQPVECTGCRATLRRVGSLPSHPEWRSCCMRVWVPSRLPGGLPGCLPTAHLLRAWVEPLIWVDEAQQKRQ